MLRLLVGEDNAVDRVFAIQRPYALSLAATVRNRDTPPELLETTLRELGAEVARVVVEQFYLVEEVIRTPLDVEVRAPVQRTPLTVAVSTSEDLTHFTRGLRGVVGDCELGWMDFRGVRGTDALDADIREAHLPDLRGQRVNTLLIAKATLATGCTALHLTRSAVAEYTPDRLIITTIFYSNRALDLLFQEFPGAYIFAVGDPDAVNQEGLLLPGIGILADRMREEAA